MKLLRASIVTVREVDGICDEFIEGVCVMWKSVGMRGNVEGRQEDRLLLQGTNQIQPCYRLTITLIFPVHRSRFRHAIHFDCHH